MLRCGRKEENIFLIIHSANELPFKTKPVRYVLDANCHMIRKLEEIPLVELIR